MPGNPAAFNTENGSILREDRGHLLDGQLARLAEYLRGIGHSGAFAAVVGGLTNDGKQLLRVLFQVFLGPIAEGT